ncbi:MAG: sulfotransferase family protein [Chloroflexota bacterium]
MQVIGSGFGRTGTLSLKTALEILGFGRCYHMMEVPLNPAHVKWWAAAARGESVDWVKMFRSYGATVDFPASVYYPELLQAFPDAKVLHTVRDEERWYESTLETIFQPARIPLWVTVWIPFIGAMHKAMDTKVWGGLFADSFEEREYAIKVFNDYTAQVVNDIPPEQLLVFDVKQGWQPLCEFLGVPVPDIPFPHRNGRASMKRMLGLIRLGPWLLLVSLLALLAWVVTAI